MDLENEVDDNIGNRKSDIRNENHNKEDSSGLRKRKRFNLPQGVLYGKGLRWLSKKGYGFLICGKYPGEHIFVHHDDIIAEEGEFRALKDNKFYSFKLEKTERGYRAREVTLL